MSDGNLSFFFIYGDINEISNRKKLSVVFTITKVIGVKIRKKNIIRYLKVSKVSVKLKDLV